MNQDIFKHVWLDGQVGISVWKYRACETHVFSICGPDSTWSLGCTLQSVNLPLTFLPECSYSSPLKEPFLSPCGRPSFCPSLFSRLAALCVLSISAILHVSLPRIHIHQCCLTKVAERWRFYPLVFKASLAVLSDPLVPALCPVLAYIWQRRWNMKVAWLLLPSYPHFISSCVSSCSRLFRLRCLPHFPPLVVSCS